ncbi:MAG: hypothetical protein JO290_13490, partial [Sphingomonadaceae bacterium]|nr:hypothetical protein [Sphingomonadaceae bacterium]
MVNLLSGPHHRGGGLVVAVVGETPLVGDSPALPVTLGFAPAPGARVPTRPSPAVPAVLPTGGVTPGHSASGTSGMAKTGH